MFRDAAYRRGEPYDAIALVQTQRAQASAAPVFRGDDLYAVGWQVGRAFAADPTALGRMQAAIITTITTTADRSDPAAVQAAVHAFCAGCVAGMVTPDPRASAYAVCAIALTPELLDQVHAPMILLDPAGCVYAANRAVMQLAGMAQGRLEGSLARGVADYPALGALLPRAAWESVESVGVEGVQWHTVTTASGTIRWMRMPLVCVLSGEPRICWLGRRDAAVSAPSPMPTEEHLPAGGSVGAAWGLSEREQTVLIAMMHGATNQAIAEALGLTCGTVKHHVHRMIHKLGVANRTAAIAWAWQHGMGAAVR